MKTAMLSALFVTASLGVAGCTAKKESNAMEETGRKTDLVWAVNVGGEAYDALDGTRFEAENDVSGGEVAGLDIVKGTQDPTLYRTYRAGDVRIEHALANGIYDVTFHFAEPDEGFGGERRFDAFIGDNKVIDNLNVMGSRDGKAHSALTITIPNVEISDGALSVSFATRVGDPVISALTVRSKQRPAPAWRMVWNDEFDKPALDATRWNINVWPPRKVNDEDQAYTDRERNLRIEDNHLIIEAHKEDYEGAKYTSGRVHSDGKGDFLYGRVEVRARLPRGMGSWPAIWMLPSDPFRYATTCGPGEDWQGSSTCDAWPNSGEIDIMEHVGYEMGHVHGTVHNEAYYWMKWEQRKGRILLDDVDKKFHVYAIEWSPERIDAFVDDVHYFTYINENTGWRAWPFDQPFHLIMNVAVGGQWGRAGGGIDDSIFPLRMEVDYVRVYEDPGSSEN
ncbi:MAG: family 16 glycosylhydrolase [Pseudomonadota bacterium]